MRLFVTKMLIIATIANTSNATMLIAALWVATLHIIVLAVISHLITSTPQKPASVFVGYKIIKWRLKYG